MKDRGEVASGVAVLVASGGIAAIVAVSEDAARNANFTQAVLGIVVILLGGATFVNRRWNKSLEARITNAIAEAVKPIEEKMDGLEDNRKRMEERQVTFQRQYEDDRLTDRRRADQIFEAAEHNRLAAEAAGIEGLQRLPHDPHP
jgi:lysyl-tRNA synthetase class II